MVRNVLSHCNQTFHFGKKKTTMKDKYDYFSLMYKGRAGPVEPSTGAKAVALFKKGVVHRLAPGLSHGHFPGTISEAPTRSIKKISTKHHL